MVTFAHGVLEIVRDDVVGAIARLQGEFHEVSLESFDTLAKAPVVPRKASPARPKGVYPEQLSHDPYCEWPGCSEAHRGPRNHYLCEEHKNAPPEELAAFLQARKAKKLR